MEHREKKYLRAKKRVTVLKNFYGNLFSSLVVMLFVAGLNYYLNQWKYPWFLWVVFGMGIGLVFSAFKVFGNTVFFGRNWEQRKMQEFLKEEEQQDRWK